MRIPFPAELPGAEKLGTVHFVGIGGAGLSAIARLMRQRGVRVQGSDARDSAVLNSLRREGITCFVGHAAAHLAAADTVIASTAVREDNPEIVEAQRRGLRLWPRSAGLASLMTPPVATVAVAGTHGKTTTTGMLACALVGAGADPSFAIGAEVPALGTNARAGADPVFVVEADESDGAFLHYFPGGAIVTNVDADHLDVWGTPAAYERAFADFVTTVGRFLVVNVEDPGAARLGEIARAAGLRVVTVGFAPTEADVVGHEVRVEGTSTRLEVTVEGDAHRLELMVPGRHYALDALLALAAGRTLGYPVGPLLSGLGTYRGAARRMEFKGEAGSVRVYDSYAHHPTELAADLAAARALAGDARLVAVFQPHLVSRTRIFGTAMGEALSAADEVAVLDIYLAREEPDPAVTAQLVADAVTAPARVVGGVAAAPAELVKLVRPGDVVVTLGAGDVTEVGPGLLALLEDRGE